MEFDMSNLTKYDFCLENVTSGALIRLVESKDGRWCKAADNKPLLSHEDVVNKLASSSDRITTYALYAQGVRDCYDIIDRYLQGLDN